MAKKNKNNNSLVFADNGYLSYVDFSKLSFANKLRRRLNIAKAQFDNGSLAKAGYALVGGYDPENPRLNTGEPTILPSRGVNPKTVLNVAKGVRTLEDYLKTTKVTAQALEGSSAARSAYATDRYLGGVVFENNLPEVASQIQGHGMAKASTLLENLARLRYILDNGLEKGKTFFTAPLKVSDARIGSALGTGGGKPYFDGHFLITGKPGLMINSVDDIGTIYINDAYENEEALKAALKIKAYLQLTYPNRTFKLYSEGFKQGGKMNILEFLKNGSGIHIKKKNKGSFTRWCGGNVTEECIRRGKNSPNPKIRKKATFALNARRWKHKSGGIIKALEGTKTNFFLKAGNWISNNKDLVSSVTNAGLGIVNNIKLNKAIDAQIEANERQMKVNKQQAFMDNYTKALGMLSDRSDIVNRNKAWLIANSLNYSNDELENENFLLQQSKVGMLDYLGGLSTDILNAFSNKKKSSSNNPPSDSYFGNYVKTLFKNPGTFNSDGSFNTSLGAYKFENGKYLKVNTNPLSNLKFNI